MNTTSIEICTSDDGFYWLAQVEGSNIAHDTDRDRLEARCKATAEQLIERDTVVHITVNNEDGLEIRNHHFYPDDYTGD